MLIWAARDNPRLLRAALVLQCPLRSPLELIESPWRMPGISMGAGAPVLAVHAVSPTLDGITPCRAPVLSASHQDEQRHNPCPTHGVR